MLGLILALATPARATADPAAPIKTVSDSLVVPEGVDPEAALQSVEDIARIFELYEPAIPWVPGVKIALQKEVVSAGTPTVLELPVSGNAAGKAITERAHVIATSAPTTCAHGPGRTITLDFAESSYNIQRRIDRIEIEACLERQNDGKQKVAAVGRMYAGFKPEDPELNAFLEAIGSKAIQGAFLRQVDPILEAVEAHWQDLPHS